jgi:hypothetical protein
MVLRLSGCLVSLFFFACDAEVTGPGLDGGRPSGSDARIERPDGRVPDGGSTPSDGGFVECSAGGTVIAGRCVCEPGHTGATCAECLAGYELMGARCVALPTEWMPYTADENFDRERSRITGFPATISYNAGGDYPTWIGVLRHSGERVGECEMVPDALLGVAPALRCSWTRTYEDSADPSMGGDPYGFGQTYLGPGSFAIDESAGNVTAISIAFMWRFGAGWFEAMAYRDNRSEMEMWADFPGVNVGGAGGKPLISHREECEYWFDVSSTLAASAARRYTGALEAPHGILPDSLEIVSGSSFVRSEGGTLYAGDASIGTVDEDGNYDFTLPASFGGGDLDVFYRTRPPDGDPLNARFRSEGVWRDPLSTDGCRERPMMLGRTIGSEGGAWLPAMSLTMGDDIACYCYDWDGTECHDPADTGSRPLSFRVGSSENDDPGAGIYHVGVAEPMFVELRIDPTNDVLELRVTTPDGRFDDTVVSRSSFCDTPNNGPVRYQDNPHRYGRITSFGEPFWALPLTTVPANAWHEVGQWHVTAAVDGAPLAPQGPPLGFVRR